MPREGTGILSTAEQMVNDGEASKAYGAMKGLLDI